MNKKSLIWVAALSLILPACDWFHKTTTRETIFDKIVNIPDKLILDIPHLPPLCDEIPNLKKGFADILDGKLYYEEEGRGISLVLINGGPGCTHHGFHPYFSKIKDVARIIYYDQRGTGKSSWDDTGKTYNAQQAVEDLESLRKSLKIEKWAVLGWSFGGFLAQCYALTYPEHVTGLILVVSETKFSRANKIVKEGQNLISQAEWVAIGNIGKMASEGKLTTAQIIYNKQLAGDWKNQYYYKPTRDELIRKAYYIWNPAPGFEKLMRQDVNKISLMNKFDDFEIPTLIIESKWELLWWDIDRNKVMRKNHPHAQIEVFEKSGHTVFADEPEKFFPLLRNFLEKSSKMHIAYRPGNRLVWPKALDEYLGLYQQSIAQDSGDFELWKELFWAFYWNPQHAEKALEALRRYEMLAKTQNPEELQKIGYCIKVWHGQLLDLLGRRDEAVKCYKEVLQNIKGRNDWCRNDYCRYVSRDWLEYLIKTPFTFDLWW